MARNIFYILFLISIFSCKPKKSQVGEPTMQKVADTYQFYVGTYTEKEGHVDGKADGIYSVIFRDSMKSMDIVDVMEGIKNPTFLALNQGLLYAASEIGGRDGDKSAYLYTFKGTDQISKVGTSSYGACHVSVSPDGKWTIVSNYSGGITAFYEGNMVKFIEFPGKGLHDRQDASHPHSSTWSIDGKYLYVADLGTDLIYVIEVDSGSKTFVHNNYKDFKIKSESGPRHMAVSADGTILYVLNELNATISICKINPSEGSLNLKNTTNMLPEGLDLRKSGADIHLHPSGKYLYVTNRVHNSISVFEVGSNFTLSLIDNVSTRGQTPRNFAITKDGKFLLAENQDSGDIGSFNILNNGKLKFLALHKIPTPVCLVEF